jgi:hypothetical protein
MAVLFAYPRKYPQFFIRNAYYFLGFKKKYFLFKKDFLGTTP